MNMIVILPKTKYFPPYGTNGAPYEDVNYREDETKFPPFWLRYIAGTE